MKPKNRKPSIPCHLCWMITFTVAICFLGCQPPPRPLSQSLHESSIEWHPIEITTDDSRAPILITVSISPEARVKAAAEDIAMELQQGVWKDYLIEIDNAAGITAPLAIESEQVLTDTLDNSRDRWLQIQTEPNSQLTGSRKEIRKLRLKSRDRGVRTAILNFNAGQGTQDLGFRSDVLLTFKVRG